MIGTLCCLSSGLNATGHSLLFSLEEGASTTADRRIHSRCLINAGDSTQRFCMDNKIKLMRVTCLVVSSLAPHNVSGLAGILLCLADLGAASLTIIAPPGIKGLLHTMTPFTNRKYPELTIIEVSAVSVNDGSQWQRVRVDDCVEVHAHPICATSAATESASAHIVAIAACVVLRRKCESHVDSCLAVLPATSHFHTAPTVRALLSSMPHPPHLAAFTPISAACNIHNLIPAFASLCARSKLTAVWINTGLVDVDIEHVEITKAQERLSILCNLCPPLFARSFASLASSTQALLDGTAEMEGSGVNDVENEENTDEMAADTHIIPSGTLSRASPMLSLSAASASVAINDDSDDSDDDERSSPAAPGGTVARPKTPNRTQNLAKKCAAAISMMRTVRAAVPLSTLSVPLCVDSFDRPPSKRPRTGRDPDEIDLDDNDTTTSSSNPALSIPPAMRDAVIALPAVSVVPIPEIPPPGPMDTVVTFLGTGSATPSRLRGNSCIMLQFPVPLPPLPLPAARAGASTSHSAMGSVRVLLDCGEGAAGQLLASCGGNVKRFCKALLSIRLVWLSHHHADHIAGLPLLMQFISWAHRVSAAEMSNSGATGDKVEPHKVVIIAPPIVLSYYEYALCIAGLDDLVSLVPIFDTLFAGATTVVSRATLGCITRLTSVSVEHCQHAYAVVIETSAYAGRPRATRGTMLAKLVYSGDCRPSSSLIAAGRGCDLLIHEATFDDTLASDAAKKRHCTTSEASSVGRAMGAQHVVLTHFSQRYHSFSQVATESTMSGRDRHFAIAFDFLVFAFPSQARILAEATTAIAKLLQSMQESRDDGEDRVAQ